MPGREERKVVTILFTDIVGSTAMAEQLDPEDVRAVLTPYYTRLRDQIEQRGGTVEKFIGDAVMAVFGAPVAHEDDPIRAVLAAIAIRDAVDDDLQIRTAVNTGEALVALDADPAAGEAFVSGDVVNTAARLQSAAPVNGILVGEATWRATRHTIDYRDAEPVEAKGKSRPVPVWEVVSAHSRLGTDVEQVHTSALVGRERELFLLEDALARCRSEQTAQLVTLVGVPGIGKSRLVSELMTRLDDSPELYWWRQGRSLPYGESRSVWALGEIVKAQAGILETDDAEAAQGKLDAMLAELLPDEEERRWVASNVHALAGLAGPTDESSDRRTEAFAAWRRLFEALAEQRPLVLVFEDLHWADDTLLDFVDHLAEWVSGVPMLIVATARPELLDRRPGWGGGKRNATTLSISPLTEAETAKLLANVLDRAVLDAETQQAVLRRAEGNPLYAAEYARMLADHEGEDLPLPETVQGLIAARIDGLPAEEKALLQDASVLGKVFWPGAVGSPSDELLHALERREFVRRDRRSAVAGETQYAFLHLLVRDVAYGQIPRARRLEKHAAAAAWLESLAPDRSEDRADLLAHHYREALVLAQATGLDTSELRRPALAALADASERAAALGSYAAAAELAREALDLTADDEALRPELQLRLARSRAFLGDPDVTLALAARDGFLALGVADKAAESEAVASRMCWWLGDGDAVRTHDRHALELCRDLPTSVAKASVFAHAAGMAVIGGEMTRAAELAHEAFALADELDLDDLRSRALTVLGLTSLHAGKREGIEHLRRSVELAERSNSPIEIARSWNNYAAGLHVLGLVAEAQTAWEEGRSSALRFGSTEGIVWSGMARALHRLVTGDLDETLAEIEALRAQTAEDAQAQLFLRSGTAWVLAARGDFEAALAELEPARARAQRVGDPQAIAPILAATAFALFAAGRDAEADRGVVPELLGNAPVFRLGNPLGDLALPLGERGRGAEWLAAYADVPLRESAWLVAGRAAAEEDFARAADAYAAMGARFFEAWARLIAAERGDLAQLEPAHAFFAAQRATPFLRRCEAVLAASA